MRCLSPISVKDSSTGHYIGVPCGRCYACLSNRRAEWSFRCSIENRRSKASWFVTLTYEDSNTDGNVYKRDLQLFFKRFRKELGKRVPGCKLSYYFVSEYGPKTFRPHYHGLMFFNRYVSEYDFMFCLSVAWDLGFFSVGPVSDADIHYCTGYVMAKDESPSGLNPTFCLMSRKPAIGSNYLDGSYLHNVDNAYVVKDGFRLRMPRYYKSKIYSKAQLDLMKRREIERLSMDPPKDYTPENLSFYRSRKEREFSKKKY